MKKFIGLLLVCLSLSGNTFVQAEPADKEIEKAFLLTFRVFVDCAIKSALGALPEGVTGQGMNMELSKVNIASLKIKDSLPYQLVSGKITVKNKNDIYADLILNGGEIKNLSWVVKDYVMTKKTHTAKVTADNKTITCTAK